MKKIILFFSLIACMVHANADNTVQVSSVIIPQGGAAELEIALDNSDDFTGFQMTLTLPVGVSLTSCNGSARLSEHTIGPKEIDATRTLLTCYPANLQEPTNIKGNSGVLFTLTLSVDPSLTQNSVIEANLSNIKFTDFDELPIPLEDVAFTITIGEPDDGRINFNETEMSLPPYPENEPVNVSVVRTIKANEWSTICLPFAMTMEQVKAAFGEDVQLADFRGVETEEDAENNTIGLTVNFSNVTNLEANHPYIIKVSEPVTTFTVDGVTIEPSEKIQVDRDEYIYSYTFMGKTYTVTFYNSFIGTYVAQTKIPSKALFLSGNKFYYATENTQHMKAFRGYFNFYNILTEVDGEYEVKMFIGGLETKVEGMNERKVPGTIYDLSGRKVTKPQQSGIYIVNGKKAIIK